jgi:hypothetical protein
MSNGLKKWFQEKSVKRKRAAGNVGPKPTFVKTLTKKYYGGLIKI